MIKFSAEKFGLKPNVTGFEEEMDLAYFDGEREGYDKGYDKGFDDAKFDYARKKLL